MSLPYLPGIGDTLAEHLPKIGQNIAHIINPYREQEDMFQKLIATDPSRLDEFIAREQASPGILSGVFGKKVSNFVGQQPLSESYKLQKESERTRAKTEKLSLDELQRRADFETRKTGLFDSIIKDPNASPEFKAYATANHYGLPDVGKFKQQELDRQNAEMQKTLNQMTLDDQTAIRDPKIQQQIKDLKIDDMAHGKIDANISRLIFNNPGYAKYFGDLLNNYQQRQNSYALYDHQLKMLDIKEEKDRLKAGDGLLKEKIKERARLIDLQIKTEQSITKTPLKGKDDPRLGTLNDTSHKLYEDHGMPLRLYEYDDGGWFSGPKLKAINLGGGADPAQVAIGGGLPPDFKLQEAVDAWNSYDDDQKKAFAQKKPEIAAVIQQAIQGASTPQQQAVISQGLSVKDILDKGRADRAAAAQKATADRQAVIESPAFKDMKAKYPSMTDDQIISSLGVLKRGISGTSERTRVVERR